MRKRLRKKLRGEFQELGFAIAFAVRAPVGSEAALDIIDVFITAFDRGSVTEGQRRSVLDWLRAHPSISNVRSGPLIDVWQSREERFDVTAA